jgi:hypothetical protein
MAEQPIAVTKLAHWVPVIVRDGVPCCRCCDEPMTQVGPGQWQCELVLAMGRRLRELLADEQLGG